jgi:hypothetical protein
VFSVLAHTSRAGTGAFSQWRSDIGCVVYSLGPYWFLYILPRGWATLSVVEELRLVQASFRFDPTFCFGGGSEMSRNICTASMPCQHIYVL